MNNSIYLCYKRSLTSIIAASLVYKNQDTMTSAIYSRKHCKNDFVQKYIKC